MGLFLVLTAAVPGVSSAQDVRIPSEDAVVVSVDPGSTDRVTVFLPVRETDDPEARIRARAAEAGLPVYSVGVRQVDARVTKYVNGQLVSGGKLYQTRIATDVDDRRGALDGELAGQALVDLAPTDSPTVFVVVPRGVSVQYGEPWSPSLWAQGYALSTTELSREPVTYRFPTITVALLGTVVLGSFLGAYAISRRSARSRAGSDAPLVDRVEAIRQTEGRWELLGPILPVAVGVWLGAHSLFRLVASALLPTVPSGAWWTATSWLVTAALFACATWLGSTLGIGPLYHDLVDRDYDIERTLVDWGQDRILVVFWYWVGGVVLLTAWPRIVRTPALGGVVVTLLVLVRRLTLPAALRLLGLVETVSEDLRAEVTEWCTRQGVPVRGVYRLNTGTALLASAFATGVPGYYLVYLTDDLVERCDSETVRGALAHELGHLTNYHFFVRIGFTLLYWVLAFVVYVSVFRHVLVLFGAFVVYYLVGLSQLGTRQEFAADTEAAAATSPEQVAEAIDRLASIDGRRRGAPMAFELVPTVPTIEERIDRLRAEDGADENEGDRRETDGNEAADEDGNDEQDGTGDRPDWDPGPD